MLMSLAVETLIDSSTASIYQITKTLTSTITVPASPAMTSAAADSATSVSTAIAIPTLPSAFDSPLATGKEPTPIIAVVTMIAVMICALILLLALLYFIFLRFRGKCPNCPRYEDEIKKWKNGELKPISSDMVKERMRAWDVEKGPTELQAKTHQDMMRMQSLASLEGQTLDERFPDNHAASVLSNNTADAGKVEGQVVETSQARAESQESIPAHVIAAIARFEGDTETTLVAPEFPRTHSAYLEEVVASREAEAERSRQEDKKQAIVHYLGVASDQSNRESVQQRAILRANEILVEQEEQDEAGKKSHLPAPRTDGKSRFRERFSLETIQDIS